MPGVRHASRRRRRPLLVAGHVGFRTAGTARATSTLDTAAALVQVLSAATATPDDVFVAVWDGWGDQPVAGDHDLIIALEQRPDLEVVWRQRDDPANSFEALRHG